MTPVERREPFAVLNRRCADEGVAKFETMASAISPQALTGELARRCVKRQRGQAGKKGSDSHLLSGPHSGSYFCAAHRRVAKSFARRCLRGDPARRPRVATKDLDQHVGVEDHTASRSIRRPRRWRLTYASVVPRSARSFHTPKAPARSASRKSSLGLAV